MKIEREREREREREKKKQGRKWLIFSKYFDNISFLGQNTKLS